MGGQLSPSRLSIARTAMNQPRPRRRMSRRDSMIGVLPVDDRADNTLEDK